MSEPPLIEVLKNRFPSEIVNPYGEVLVIPSRLFQPGWEADLKRQGHQIYTSSYNGEAAFFIRLKSAENESFSATMANAVVTTTEKDRELRILPIGMIVSSPEPIREDYEDINSLAATIQSFGLIHPIVVRKDITRGYVVLVGERRLRACQRASLSHVPCMVVKDALSEEELLELRLVENLQRNDLKPAEKTRAFQTLRDKFHLSQRQIAEKVGLSVSRVNDYLALGGLPSDVQQQVEAGSLDKKALTVEKAHLLAKSDLPPEKVRHLTTTVKEKGLTTKALTKRIAAEEPVKVKRTLTGRRYWRELTKSLREFANYWSDCCEVKEWETVSTYNLELTVTLPKDPKEEA